MSQNSDDAQEPRARVVYKLIENHIEKYQLKIKALEEECAEGWVDESISIYDKAIEQARDRISQEKFADLLYDYGCFLRNWFSRVSMLYDYESFLRHSDSENCLAKYHLADSMLNESLGIYRQLAEKSPDAFLPSVAKTLKEMGYLHHDLHRFDEAEREWVEALDIYRKQENLTGVFLTLNALEAMHLHSRDHGSGTYKALDIIFDEKDPYKLRSVYADISIILAGLHKKLHCFDKAESDYAEALKKYSLLAMVDADKFRPYVANTLCNLAFLHTELHRDEEAEREYEKALEIFQAISQETHIYDGKKKSIAESLERIKDKYKS